MVLICGRLISDWEIRILIFFCVKKVHYVVYGVRKVVKNCLWLGFALITCFDEVQKLILGIDHGLCLSKPNFLFNVFEHLFWEPFFFNFNLGFCLLLNRYSFKNNKNLTILFGNKYSIFQLWSTSSLRVNWSFNYTHSNNF